MSRTRRSAALLVLGLASGLLPAAAQERDSLQVEIIFKTQEEARPGYTFCTSLAIGSHPDPVGNGNDYDYFYSRSPVNRTPHEWTGLRDDIAGQRITYTAGTSTGGDGGDGCADNFARHKDYWDGIVVWAYFTPPPNPPPTACFTFEEADEPLTIAFDASCASDPNGTVVRYDWDFGGDGTQSGSGAQTRFTYDEPGTYVVTLVVTDDGGKASVPTVHEVEVTSEDLLVNSTDDEHDEDAADESCDTGQTILRDGEPEPECTLRAAIEEANARGGGEITFDIPGEGTPTIRVTEYEDVGESLDEALPAIKAPVTIDGTTQPGAGWVEISGQGDRGAQILDAGLWIRPAGGGTTIRGLVINRFYGAGLFVQGDGCRIEGNLIGTDVTGTQARGNTFGRGGLFVLGRHNVIVDNVLAGNVSEGYGAELMLGSRAQSNQVLGNRIGVGTDGRILGDREVPPNGGVSAGIAVGGSGNVIGGLGGDPSVACETPCNLVYGYDYAIVATDDLLEDWWVLGTIAARNEVLGNAIGVDGSLQPAADSPMTGPKVWLGAASTVEGNYIAAINQGALAITSSSVVRNNVVVGHADHGGGTFAGLVSLDGMGAELRGNEITTSASSGVVLTGEGGHLVIENEIRGHDGGIAVTGGEGNRIEANEITDNRHFGILLSDYFDVPGALLTRNRIYDTGIGIDLGGGSATQTDLTGDGVTLNDVSDVDDGPNGLLNFPVPLQVARSGRLVQVEGLLWGAYSGTTTVEVFVSTTCAGAMAFGVPYGAGEHYLGAVTVTPGPADFGEPAFEFAEGGLEGAFEYVTLTATRPDLGVTSEFSRCVRAADLDQTARADVGPDQTGRVLDAQGVAVAVTRTGAAAKARGTAGGASGGAAGGTLYVTRYESAPDTSAFADTSATAPSGAAITPGAAVPRHWYLADRGLTRAGAAGGDTLAFEVCLDPTGTMPPASTGQAVVLQRGEATAGRWVPRDTDLQDVGGTPYLCAAGLTALGEFGIGVSDAAAVPVDEAGVRPEAFVLHAAFPNPFSAQTTIRYDLPAASAVTLTVYDLLGREVARLFDGTAAAGRHDVTFDARDLPSGLYFFRISAGGFTAARQVLLTR